MGMAASDVPKTVVLTTQDLRRDVVGRATKGGCRVTRAYTFLAHAVVGELNVAFVVEQNVVQFQIAVDDALLVQEIERQRDLCRVEARVLLWKAALALHVEHEVSAPHELDHEEQPRRCLETRVQADQERMVGRRFEHVLLRLHPVDILEQNKTFASYYDRSQV